MMKENTFAVSLTLEDLKRRRLVIPCFQRPYRWTRDEAAVLFDDLMAFQEVAKLDSSIRYSLGTIVTARLDPRGEELFVLDGQQRLTTVALLENVLESHLDKEMADEKAPLPPKWLSYRNLPEGASFPGRWKKAGRKEVFDSNGVRDAFEERLSMSKDDSVGLDPERVLELLRNRVFFNLAEVPLESLAQTNDQEVHIEAAMMFENVNVRGVPLTDADILKAQLVERMDPDDADFYDQTWSAILKALALNSVEALPDLSKIEVKAVSTTHGGPLSDILKRSRGQKVRVLAGTGSDEGKGGRSSSTHAALDATMLLVTARVLWKALVNQDVDDYLTREKFQLRFKPLLDKDEARRCGNAWQFLHLMLVTARFVLEWCPKSGSEGLSFDNETNAKLLGDVGEELLETLMAESGGATGRYWIVLGVLLYRNAIVKNGGRGIEDVTSRNELKQAAHALKPGANKGFAKDLVDRLKAWGARLAFEKGIVPSVELASQMANEEPQPLPDNSSTEHWLYPGRRYLFWTDWLIRCDRRQNFDVMKKVFADLSTKFFEDPNSQVKFFKDLGDRIEKSRITFSGQVEHWVPQADDRASRLLAGEARHLDEEPRQIDIFGNLALIDASLNSKLTRCGSQKKAEIVKQAGGNLSVKLLWLTCWSELCRGDLDMTKALPVLNAAWNQFALEATRKYAAKAGQ